MPGRLSLHQSIRHQLGQMGQHGTLSHGVGFGRDVCVNASDNFRRGGGAFKHGVQNVCFTLHAMPNVLVELLVGIRNRRSVAGE